MWTNRSFKEGKKNDQISDDGRNDNNGGARPTFEAETFDSDRPFAAPLNVAPSTHTRSGPHRTASAVYHQPLQVLLVLLNPEPQPLSPTGPTSTVNGDTIMILHVKGGFEFIR